VPGAVWTIVVAAGTGSRFGGPKQFAELGDRRVIDWACAPASAVSEGVVLVVPPGNEDAHAVAGGTTRAESVRRGLAAVPADAAIVVVHDAARPFARAELFEGVIAAVRAGADGAIPAIPVPDTIKEIDPEGVVMATLDRSRLVAVQTPQAFRADVLRRAHADGAEGTDDAALVEAAGGRVVTVPGDPANRKITEPADLEWARQQVTGAPRR
jgi:2-C-methyl-D-erythritol 4-phosphate cytidylyltransferase